MDHSQTALQYTAFVTDLGDHIGFEFMQVPGCFGTAANDDVLYATAKEVLENHLRIELKTSRPPSWPRMHRSPEVRERRLLVTVAPGLAFALQLKRMRLRKGWSQAEVARRAGVTQQQVAKLEDPNSNPTFAMATRVGVIFDRPLVVAFK